MRFRATSYLVLVAVLVLVFLSAGCAGQPAKHTGAGNTTGNGLPTLAVQSPEAPEISGLAPGDLPLCYSPDRQTIYLMNYADSVQDINVVLGDYTRLVDLYRVDHGQRTRVAAGIPFVTLARWSPDGKYLGLAGGKQLYLLDAGNNRLDPVNKLVNLPAAVFFGWSPDSKTVYVEHDHVVNGAVFNVGNHTGLPSYRMADNPPFFKAALDGHLFIGTVAHQPGAYETVIMDQVGNVQQSLGSGKFRDLNGNSILQVGAGDFGLAFKADINNPADTLLTDQYVYQCRFLPQGGIIYTTPGETGAELDYDLTLITPNSRKTVKVSGPHFNIWPDGRFVDICGYRTERLNLPELSVAQQQDRPLYEAEKNQIIACARGAISAYVEQYHGMGNLDEQVRQEELSRYYTDTREPVEQVALTDIWAELKHRPRTPHRPPGACHVNAQIKTLAMHGDDRASLVTGCLSRHTVLPAGDAEPGLLVNTAVYGASFEVAYELVKQDGNWYVTGLSTFPYARERERVAALARDFIASAQKNDAIYFQDTQSRQFFEQIRGKELRAGQIQFWAMSDPHRSPAVEHANYALVYLSAGNERYELVLCRASNQDWQFERLTDDSHPGLF